HVWEEKANDGVYLKFAAPPAPPTPFVISPGPKYIAFGYDVDRALAAGPFASAPPPAGDPSWKPVNNAPVLIVKVPSGVPATPPDALVDALKAEIPDAVANAKIPGPGSVDSKKMTLALQNWDASRTRPDASTFQNTDFDFGDRGQDLIAPPAT